MVTIIEVAKRAKVSPSTVSRYIRCPEMVSEEKTIKIKQAINELGYTPNLGASLLKSNDSNLVGLVIPNSHNYLFSRVIELLTNRLTEKNMKLIIAYSNSFDEMKQHIKTMISLRCMSVLYLPERRSHTISVFTISNNVYPLQLFIDCTPQLDSIIFDDEEGAYLAAKELIKSGNKNLVLVDGYNEVFLKRKSGVEKAFKEFNIPFDEENNICPLGVHINVVEEVMNHLHQYKNDAIIAVSEGIAQETCLALQQMGKSVPQDISLIVYDDSPWARLSNYSVIAHPIESLVNDIVDLIIANHNGQKDINKIVLSPIFLKRGSIKEKK